MSGADAAGFVVPPDMRLAKSLDAFGVKYERYQQHFGRAAVLGGQITLYRDASGAITLVIGARHVGVVARNVVGLSRAKAAAVVERELGAARERLVDLLIDPDSGRYFFRVETRSGRARWFHWIDAASGGVLRKYDARQTGQGVGVKGDTKSFAGPDGQPGSADDLTTFHNAAAHGVSGPHYDLYSRDGRQKTYDAGNGIFFAQPVGDADDQWTLPGDASPGHPALVDAHYYAKVTDDYFRDRLALDWIADCGYATMRSVAHYDAGYVNAFWDGTSVSYGDGDGIVARELSGALDIVAHEHGHGVTQCTSNLIYQDEPGALNEAFSDMLGSAAEFYADSRGLDGGAAPDWFIGEDVYLLSSSGFRNMADPEDDGNPDHYSERFIGSYDNGGVHINSGIPNHAFYLLVNGGSNAGEARGHPHSGPVVTPIPLAAAERIAFQAFTGLAENADMCDARAASEAAASALYGPDSQERVSTTDAWLAVGLTDTVCLGAPPAAPSALTATAVSSSRINLSWADNSPDEDGFKLERSPDGVSFSEIASLGPGVTSHADLALVASSSYSYRIRAFAGSAFSGYSAVASATTQPPPTAPSGLTALAVSSGRIDLAWLDNAAGEAGYKLERSSNGSGFAEIATLPANATSYSNTGLAGATTYQYRVRAYEGPNFSGYSNLAQATTLPPPAAPTGLSATPTSPSQIVLNWVDNATNETSYKVERSTDGVSFAQIISLGANVRTYTNSSLLSATTYYYRVAASDGANLSAYSNVAQATTLVAPAAPTNLTATPASSSRINLTWVDNATNEQGYKVERSTDGVNFTQIILAGANATSYANTNLVASTTYHYRVRAYNGSNNSDYSNVASATTPSFSGTPSSLAASAVASSRIDLSWVDNATNEQGFKLERSTGGGSFTQIATLAANLTSYASTGLTAGTSYSYRVRAYDGPNNSGYSNLASATTLPAPAAPTGLTATPVASSTINLAWTDVATSEQGYKVERSTNGVSFTTITTLAANVTSYASTSLTASTTYYYRVRAYDGPNYSGYSNVAPATTLPAPAAPTSLTATAISATRITLGWTDNSNGETGFKLERSTNGVSFSQISTLGANVTSYTNTVASGTTYYYRVRAYEGGNHSSYSNVAQATTP